MKVRVVSLKHREDRRKAFTKSNGDLLDQFEWSWLDAVDGSKMNYDLLKRTGFDTDKNWRDPILKRTLTWGEVGCFLSHYKIWEEAADTGQTIMVLEDDAILTDQPEEAWITGDITYLTHKEMLPSGVIDNKVCYPYWTAAYIITPEAAQVLLDTDIDQSIIPVDEFLPRMTDKLVMTSNPHAKQRSRSEAGTDVEPHGHKSFVRDFTTYAITCHDNDDKAWRLKQSNPKVINILNGEWKGGTMEGPGGGQKLNKIREFIKPLPDHDVVIFTDGFDVFYANDIYEIVGRFLEMKEEVVFAAEKYLWPNKHLRFPPCETPYRYLNSGCFIGRVGELKAILLRMIHDSADDQEYLHHIYLSGAFNIVLDHEQYIFQTNSEAVTIKQGTIFNTDTKCYGCVYHGNGGAEAKKRFERLYDTLHPENKYANLTVSDYRVIGNEMLLVDFLSPSQCEEWIRIGEEKGSWVPHPADKFPSHDIHLKTLGLWDDVEAWWSKVLAPVFEAYWRPTKHYQLRKAFLMKYSEDTQKTLGLHNDAAMVTGSVKLNDDYEGATLIFPRQEITNKDIPVGKMIVFPGQVTHGHYVDKLQAGTKYSATFWTARYKNDILDP